MRIVNVAGAQMGPIQKAETRHQVVARMLDLMGEAKGRGADLIVYPELALTTFFPRWYVEDQAVAMSSAMPSSPRRDGTSTPRS